MRKRYCMTVEALIAPCRCDWTVNEGGLLKCCHEEPMEENCRHIVEERQGDTLRAHCEAPLYPTAGMSAREETACK